MAYCECGCGIEVSSRFVSGHNSRVSNTLLGKHQIAWNKGLTKETDKRVATYSASLKKRFIGVKRVPWNKGKQGLQKAWNKLPRTTLLCQVCKKEMEVTEKERSTKKYCSNPCQHRGQLDTHPSKGKHSWNWGKHLYTPEEIKLKLKLVGDELGRTPVYNDLSSSISNAAVVMFGSWCNALTSAGFTPTPKWRTRTFKSQEGNLLDSSLEYDFDRLLHLKEIKHLHQFKINWTTNRWVKTDFVTYGFNLLPNKYFKELPFTFIEIYGAPDIPGRMERTLWKNAFYTSFEEAGWGYLGLLPLGLKILLDTYKDELSAAGRKK